MDRLSAMSAFVAVVEQGSFARAAERLAISTSSLSRLVADLEGHLGVRLLNRTTRRLSLTDAGQAYYERCVQLLADLSEAEAIAGQSAAAPRGRIKLTCSVAIGVQRLAPAMASFVARYPDVRFEAVVLDRIVDLVEEGIDLAIRVGVGRQRPPGGAPDRRDADRFPAPRPPTWKRMARRARRPISNATCC